MAGSDGFFMRKEKPAYEIQPEMSCHEVWTDPLPIARRYRLLKSAKADGDVEIGKYPGLVSSPAQAFPDCSSDIVCADSPLQWRDRFGLEESLFYQRVLTEFQIKSLDAYFLLYSIFMYILMPII